MAYIFVELGSAFGGMLRFFVGTKASEIFRKSFPWGTLLANITGSFIIGLLSSLLFSKLKPDMYLHYKHFLIIGFCGSYTTFSSFSLETLRLLEQKADVKAIFYIAGSFIISLICVWVGQLVGDFFGEHY